MKTLTVKKDVDGLLIDIDGTISFGGEPIAGGAEAIAALRRAQVPFRLVTNATRIPRSTIIANLLTMGIEIEPAECYTVPIVTASWLKDKGFRRVALFLPRETHGDFSELEVDDASPECVVVGHLGEGWSFDVLNRAFRLLMNGAELVALQRNRYWDAGDGLELDAGPYVAALEYASGQHAHLIGKPSPSFFEVPGADMGVPMERIAMVGDSLEGDVEGAQAAGCRGVLVRTGSFRQQELDRSAIEPDGVIDSIADLPRLLGLA